MRKYKNPPINELIIGVYFDQPLMRLRSEHIGLFWAEIRKDFPVVQQQPELSQPLVAQRLGLQLSIGGEPYPMPRFWLISEDETTLMQIQKNAFILNWRKQNSIYPHYESIKMLFDKYFQMFSLFVQKEIGCDAPKIQVAELTYSNLIQDSEYWSDASDTSALIPSLCIPDPGMPVEGSPDFNYLTSYKLDHDISLNVAVRTARKATDAQVRVLVIEFRALGALGDTTKPEADTWFNRAHDAIGRCFTSMTNPEIQRAYWQPE